MWKNWVLDRDTHAKSPSAGDCVGNEVKHGEKQKRERRHEIAHARGGPRKEMKGNTEDR